MGLLQKQKLPSDTIMLSFEYAQPLHVVLSDQHTLFLLQIFRQLLKDTLFMCDALYHLYMIQKYQVRVFVRHSFI